VDWQAEPGKTTLKQSSWNSGANQEQAPEYGFEASTQLSHPATSGLAGHARKILSTLVPANPR
jgi:hypothetical protein